MVNAFGVKDYLDVGLITAIPYGVAVLGMILLSRSSDRTGERRWHYALNVTMGCIGLILSGIFLASPILSVVFLSVATAGVIGSIPLFWPIPSAFLAGTAAAAGIGIVNSVGNLGGYIGPNVTIWMKHISADPSAPLYGIASIMFLGALLTIFFIPKTVNMKIDDCSRSEPTKQLNETLS
jgi:nitrate/nitrite transporter NarK